MQRDIIFCLTFISSICICMSKASSENELNSYKIMILKVILKMFFEKFDLAFAPSSPLSTNILFFFNWEGRLEHFYITGKYTEYSGYIFLRAGGLGQGLAERKWEVPRYFFFFLPWLFWGMSAI